MEGQYYSTVGENPEMMMIEQGADARYDYAHGSTGASVDEEKIQGADTHYDYAHGSTGASVDGEKIQSADAHYDYAQSHGSTGASVNEQKIQSADAHYAYAHGSTGASVDGEKIQGADAHFEYVHAHGSESVQKQKSQGEEAHYDYAHGSENAYQGKGEEDGAITDDIHMYEVIDMELSIKITRVTPKMSPTPVCVTNIPEYSVADKSKKKGAQKKAGNESTIENNDQYAMPMSKMDKMTNERKGIIGNGGNDDKSSTMTP